ncbi:MAG: ASKHA domain-containing protein [Methanomicrobiales archaeon]|nr:ASKHA domain-containing protein [Methanomicrobiales archaeon]MDI6876667.1 ASKHA domain-containing protein [Methanomicrobiales archaeon]
MSGLVPRSRDAVRRKARVYVHPLNRTAEVPPGTSLLEAIRRAGVQIESICGGKGECGKCRVILEGGGWTERGGARRKHLSPREVEAGYRLACEVMVGGDMEVTVPIESRIEAPQILIPEGIETDHLDPPVERHPLQVRDGDPFAPGGRSIRLVGYTGARPRAPEEVLARIPAPPALAILTRTPGYPEILDIVPEDGSDPPCGIALDLGTTTVVGTLVDLATGVLLARQATLNRQITYGEEVITRIGFSGRADGVRLLQQAARESINQVIRDAAAAAGIAPAEILEVTVGGNTVMNHLLVGRDPRYLEMVDADVPRHPFVFRTASLGIEAHPRAYCYCLPNVSRFVGGDAVGDVLASGMHGRPEVSLLIDLGTNGEIVVGNREWLAAVSCASGPAFEGAGIGAGMRAMRGAIEHVAIDPVSGEATVETVGSAPPRGICGSGLIDAAAGMFQAGILDFKGKFVGSHPRVRRGHEGAEYCLVPAEETATGQDIAITQQDMDYFMDSKAALCGAVAVLLKRYRLTPEDIRHVYLAGAFGAFADMRSLTAFGILPPFPNATVQGIGNGSLSGAYLALLSLRKRREAQAIADAMVYIDLLVDPDFVEEYTAALSIPGRSELFPAGRDRGGHA